MDAVSLVSLIIPAKNEGNHVQDTIASALSVKTKHPFEVIVIDDGSTDGCCNFLLSHPNTNIKLLKTEGVGANRARNLGVNHAKGDYLIFCDAQLSFEDAWLDRLIEPIRAGLTDATNPGIAVAGASHHIGYGLSWSENLRIKWNGRKKGLFESPILNACCLAISKSAYLDAGGFDHAFRVCGYTDQELSLRLWLFGYRCHVEPGVKVAHVFRRSKPYAFTNTDYHFNFLRMAYSHFNKDRIEKCKRLISGSNPDHIESLVLQSGVMEQRKHYFAKRKYDDDWFMEKFKIPF